MFHIDSDLWEANEILSVQDNDDLTKPFTMEEIKHALFSMKPDKALGPDNIPIEFFQAAWPIVSSDIFNMFQEFHKGTLEVQRLNYGIITLLPKLSGADKI